MSTDYVNSYEGGVGKVIAQGMRINKTAATTTLGTIRNLAIGRQIVYAKIGTAAVSAGTMLQSQAPSTGFSIMVCGATASVGAKIVNLVNTAAISKDRFKDGIFVVHCGAGTGYSYVVDYHLSAAAADLSININLKDGLEVALTTASICSLVENKYNEVLKAVAGGGTSTPVGVALCTGSVNSYAWLGKKGPWLCATGTAAITNGKDLVVGSATGTVDQLSTATTSNAKRVGVAMQSCTGNANTFVLVDLDL